MLGLILNTIVELVIHKFGANTWQTVVEQLKLQTEEDESKPFAQLAIYNDALTLSIIGEVSKLTGLPPSTLINHFGEYWLETILKDFKPILLSFGEEFMDVITNLENIHAYVSTFCKIFTEKLMLLVPGINPPSFWITNAKEHEFYLHYRSGTPKTRPGFYHIVFGALTILGRFFNLDIHVETIQEHTIEKEHIFRISNVTGVNVKEYVENMDALLKQHQSINEVLSHLFPFHIIFDKKFDILHLGTGWSKYKRVRCGTNMMQHFHIWRPLLNTWDFELIKRLSNMNTFTLDYKFNDKILRLFGQMKILDENYVVFVCNPMVQEESSVLTFKDFAIHSNSRLELFRFAFEKTKLNEKIQMQQSIKTLRISMQEIQRLKADAERVLLNVLPKVVVEKLQSDQKKQIAQLFPNATIMFCDIVGFTKMSSLIQPTKLVNMLNKIFTTFDTIMESMEYPIEKVKTIGDCLFVVAGTLNKDPESSIHIIDFAVRLLKEIKKFPKELGIEISIRIGVNDGQIVGGIIGNKKLQWDYWGDAVNLASRMESTGIPGYIQVSATTFTKIKHVYKCDERKGVYIKGKGEMSTYIVVGKHSRSNLFKGFDPNWKKFDTLMKRSSSSKNLKSKTKKTRTWNSSTVIEIPKRSKSSLELLTPHHTRKRPNKMKKI